MLLVESASFWLDGARKSKLTRERKSLVDWTGLDWTGLDDTWFTLLRFLTASRGDGNVRTRSGQICSYNLASSGASKRQAAIFCGDRLLLFLTMWAK